jgi:RNA polymerase sigma-70 factor (ECF subfamily)
MHRITTNLFLDQARRRQRIRMDAMGEEADRYPSGDQLAAPERAFEHGNLDHDIQRALDELPPEYRAAVVLCDIEGLSYEEIAVTLGIKLGTVRSRIHRARARLRVSLEHRAPAGVDAVTADEVHA